MKAKRASTAACISVSLAIVATAGCSRDQKPSWLDPIGDGPATVGPPPHGPPPHGRVLNDAPIDNVEGKELASSLAGRGDGRMRPLGKRDAVAELTPISGGGLEGSARLNERGGGLVEVRLNVHGGKQGNREVAIRENGPCTVLPPTDPSLPDDFPAKPEKVGTLHIDQGGDGQLEATLQGVSLQPESGSSLLGRALVIYDPAKHEGSELLACAQIRSR